MNLGVRVGNACARLMDEKMRDLNCEFIEVDEVWGFIAKKQKNASFADRRAGEGDVWTYCSLDPVSKAMPSFHIGQRDKYHATAFMEDLASRLKNRIQLTADGMAAYPDAVERAFGSEVDFATLVKEYESTTPEDSRRYSPAEFVRSHKTVIQGAPDEAKICTSYIERANLTTRTHMKRLARLTLAFSKKLENLKAAFALHAAYYNFVKFHSSVRMTPAMALGVAQSPLEVSDLVDAAS